MSKFTEFLVNSLSGAIETIGESKLEDTLNSLHDSDELGWKAAIYGGKRLTSALMPVVEKSKTPIDDTILGAIDAAIEASAEHFGLDLSVPEISTAPTT